MYDGMAEQVALCVVVNRVYKPPTTIVLGPIPLAQARRSEVWRNEVLKAAQARCGTWEMLDVSHLTVVAFLEVEFETSTEQV